MSDEEEDKPYNPEAAEIGAIDFQGLLAAPVIALAEAQVRSALATVKFIKQFGFSSSQGVAGMLTGVAPMIGGQGMENLTSALSSLTAQGQAGLPMNLGKPRTISFDYYKKMGAEGTPALVRLTVPFLILIPIPAMRVASFDLRFNCKIDSSEYRSKNGTTSETKMWGRWTNTKTDSEGLNIQREYSLKCELRAQQDELPSGLAKLFDMLESAIKTMNVAEKAIADKVAKDAANATSKASDTQAQTAE